MTRLVDFAILVTITAVTLVVIFQEDYYGGPFARVATVILILAGLGVVYYFFEYESTLNKVFGYVGISAIMFLFQATIVDFATGSPAVGVVSLLIVGLLAALWYFVFFRNVLRNFRSESRDPLDD